MEGDEEACPKCQFNPKSTGLRVAMGLFMIVVLAMSVTIVAGQLWPTLGRAMIAVSGVAFVLSVVVFFISFLVTPYRFGSVFRRL
ncbi:hypothetical protein [Halorubrum vacuolatum]|uniref:hypothetical protein n=1 Tax=Halorubrum vacuolatum TaxID=63740 RepID=UPI001C53302D|nr:hypothetical protein [Halorubrum vacuolatum]